MDRILGTRDFAKSYGKVEWLSNGKGHKEIQIDSSKYKKLIVCLENGSSKDIADQVSEDNVDIACDAVCDCGNKLVVKNRCGIITVTSEMYIVSIKGLYKKSQAENRKWLVEEYGSVFVAYLVWQLRGDIDAKSSGIAYNTYVRSLSAIMKLDTVV